MMALRVLVVADDPLARAGLAVVLSTDDSLDICGQEHGAADLATAVELYRADVVLWDMGWDATSDLRRERSHLLVTQSSVLPPVLALVADADGSAELAADLRAAGARGVVLREARPPVLGAALHALAAGLVVLDPALALTNAEPAPVGAASAVLPESLTPREIEVLQLLAEGLPNKGIARRLGISEHTVKVHLWRLFRRLGVKSRTQAIHTARTNGLIQG